MPTTYSTGMVTENRATTSFPDGSIVQRRISYVTPVLIDADVIQLIPVFSGERVVDLYISITDHDTGTPALVFDVGDGIATARYINGSTAGQGGAVERMGVGIVGNTAIPLLNHIYTADDTIDFLVDVVAATAVVGVIELSALITRG